MKKILAFCLFIGSVLNYSASAQQLTTDSSIAFAETSNNYSFLNADEDIPTPPKSLSTARQRNIGIGLIGLGVGSFFGGKAMVKSAEEEYETGNYSDFFSGTEKEAFGKGLQVVGVAAVAGGIVLTILGQRKLSKKGKKRLSFDISPNSMYLAYQF